ncbi:MAG: M28 family metallopeptidase [Cyclobacteriaceae bacterium]
MKRFHLHLTLILFVTWSFAQDSILGFKQQNVDSQITLEKEFDAKLSASNLNQWMKKMSAQPHYVGTEYGRENAEWMVKQFKSWGYDAKIETYHVLFPYPKVRLLELVAPDKYTAKLAAVPVEGDESTNQGEALLPSYNAFSTDGDVEADLVFVNYGIPNDYEELEKLGISVEGKIVIAKYAGSWRGIKPKLAAEKGAIGCIIYSDPKDDGYYRGDVYPEGAFKNKTGVQRGSVMDMPTYPGDVLTPGYGATKNAKRLKREDAPTITKIPVLPISYEDAIPLLSALEGPVVPNSWKGALPITYHIGPGPAKVHLKLEFEWELKPANNVIATMKGTDFPDQWVMRGNHHDAWVHGAADPISGMVALMEEARAVGELAKAGKKPRRTVIYCAWDAEEPGLIGSTEWVEDHKQELQSKVVAYINTDGSGRGFLGVGGSHSLQAMVMEVAKSVTDPQKNVSVYERRSAVEMINGRDGDLKISALGSGSDYTPFIQHAGIAALNLGYRGENAGGDYHTIYDTYAHYTRFKDPGLVYGVTLAQTAGRLTMRLANADILPFEFKQWHSTVSTYLNEIIDLTDSKREAAEKHNAMLDKDVFQLVADPTKPFTNPKRKESVPFLDFSPLQNAIANLESKTDRISNLSSKNLSDDQMEKINNAIAKSEQMLLREEGLPRRSWFKHQLYAPGFYTGYGVKTLPGVREAVEQDNWAEAQNQIGILAEVLNNFGLHLDKISDLGGI